MQYSPQELKEKLLRHLDNDYNVLDMDGVLAVMPVLERYPITKEHLEQTRLGKYVNEMRRKTSDRHLARRAKDLVRKWQQLVASQAASLVPSAGSAVELLPRLTRVASSGSLADSVAAANGPRAAPTRPANGSYARSPAPDLVGPPDKLTSRSGYWPKGKSAEKPPPTRSSHAFSQPSTPVMRPITPVSVLSSTQPLSSQTTVAARSKAASSESCKLSPSIPSFHLPNGTGVPPGTAVDPTSRTDHSDKHAGGRNGMLKYTASANNLSCNGAWTVHSSDNPLPSSSGYGVTASPDPPLGKLKIKINRTSATGSVSSPVAEMSPATTRKPAVPKVATTAELIHRLHANGELRLVASETLNRIATNQIEHEVDDTNVSVVPDGAKPRPHKKRRTDKQGRQPPGMTDSDLLQVKAERVRNFVEMFADVTPPADNDLLGLIPRLPAPAVSSTEIPQAAIPPRELEDSVPLLPDLEGFEIDWDSNAYSVPAVRLAPTEADVDRLLTARWSAVNGQFDHNGIWTDWTQSYSMQSHVGDRLDGDGMVHILPYVDVDD